MIDVEAIQLAVADEIDAGLLLRVDHDARGVDQRLLGREARRANPVPGRIRPWWFECGRRHVKRSSDDLMPS